MDGWMDQWTDGRMEQQQQRFKNILDNGNNMISIRLITTASVSGARLFTSLPLERCADQRNIMETFENRFDKRDARVFTGIVTNHTL